MNDFGLNEDAQISEALCLDEAEVVASLKKAIRSDSGKASVQALRNEEAQVFLELCHKVGSRLHMLWIST